MVLLYMIEGASSATCFDGTYPGFDAHVEGLSYMNSGIEEFHCPPRLSEEPKGTDVSVMFAGNVLETAGAGNQRLQLRDFNRIQRKKRHPGAPQQVIFRLFRKIEGGAVQKRDPAVLFYHDNPFA